ncbi:MAG: hypothetical protein AAF576_07615 [Pseudomonadota bacterium]
MPFFASLLGLLTAGALIVLASGVAQEVMGEEMPIFLRIILAVFGALLAVVSGFALRHAFRQVRARRSVPLDVWLSGHEASDSEGTTYKVVVTLGEERWVAPAYGGAGMQELLETGPIAARAWFDPETGLPVSFEVSGKVIGTYPVVRPLARLTP